MSKEQFPEPDHDFDDILGLGKSKKYTGEFAEDDRELEEALGKIWDIAEENHLEPFPTTFEVVPAHIMNQIAAYNIPDRFSHWTFGRSYRELQTNYNYGMSKIYELVINANPSQAFLLENNPVIENKFVVAHVLGHTDFFKNNYLFANTRRDMPAVSARHARRIRDYEEEYGVDEVEEFLDAVMAIDDHIDPYVIKRMNADDELALWRKQAERAAEPKPIPTHGFEDLIKPRREETVRKVGRIALNIPPEPDRDIMGFIRNHAPYLDDWQRETIDMVRDESLYFYPQRRTKIMNEGWAAYWHKRIMREMSDRGELSPEENEAWWKVHSGVVAPNPRQLNPYYLGMKMYEYLEDYWNGNLTEQENAWLRSQGREIHPRFEGDLKDSPAAKKLRGVMMANDDQSFIRNYFDKNVADRMDMYAYEERKDPRTGEVHKVISSRGWSEIRDQLTNMLDNASTPYIVVENGDYNRAGELYLRHQFDGRELDNDYVKRTLPYLYKLWQRPVNLETATKNGKSVVYTYNGTSLRQS